MLCPEGVIVTNEGIMKEEEFECNKKKTFPSETTANNLDLCSYKNPKTWKKSITNFFRQQLRSSKSNDGDKPSGSKESFDNKDINPEQKWQSLGKVFRRQSFVDNWNKGANQQGECSSQSKRLAVRKVLSNYFNKSQKSSSDDKQ